MDFPDFTRELKVAQPSPLWGVTPFHIVAVHQWKYENTTYRNFVKNPEIAESRKPTKIQILRANQNLPLPALVPPSAQPGGLVVYLSTYLSTPSLKASQKGPEVPLGDLST